MLSKLVSQQVLRHGFRLTTRSASAAAQPKLVIDRNPEVKYQKVSSESTHSFRCFIFFSFLLIMNLLMHQVEVHLKLLIHLLVRSLLKLLMHQK
jgi:hypothetical protein